MKIGLSPARIQDAIKRIETLQDDINDASGNIVEDLTLYGGSQASKYNASAPQSGITKSEVIYKITENRTKGYVVLRGENAVYDEFGTGEEGASDGHPWKYSVNVNLNPYNSGPFVSTHINENGRHYWLIPPGRFPSNQYVTPVTYGKVTYGYTEGIPSGKQMYKTALDIRNEKKNIIEARLGYAIKKANGKKSS